MEAAKVLIPSLVLCQLDYCNSLLLGTAQYHLDELQRLQNMSCRVIHNLRKYNHISNAMLGLHGLCVNEHITYKVAVIMYKYVLEFAPKYLRD